MELSPREKELVVTALLTAPGEAAPEELRILLIKVRAVSLADRIRSMRTAYPGDSLRTIADKIGCRRETVCRVLGRKP